MESSSQGLASDGDWREPSLHAASRGRGVRARSGVTGGPSCSSILRGVLTCGCLISPKDEESTPCRWQSLALTTR